IVHYPVPASGGIVPTTANRVLLGWKRLPPLQDTTIGIGTVKILNDQVPDIVCLCHRRELSISKTGTEHAAKCVTEVLEFDADGDTVSATESDIATVQPRKC